VRCDLVLSFGVRVSLSLGGGEVVGRVRFVAERGG
jgi:hypothetical protein